MINFTLSTELKKQTTLSYEDIKSVIHQMDMGFTIIEKEDYRFYKTRQDIINEMLETMQGDPSMAGAWEDWLLGDLLDVGSVTIGEIQSMPGGSEILGKLVLDKSLEQKLVELSIETNGFEDTVNGFFGETLTALNNDWYMINLQ